MGYSGDEDPHHREVEGSFIPQRADLISSTWESMYKSFPYLPMETFRFVCAAEQPVTVKAAT